MTRKSFTAKIEKKVRFTDIYDPNSLVVIGQVKYDPFRQSLKYTALNDSGRIKDCETFSEAEMSVQVEYQLTPAGLRP